jgi:chemotaxis protein CheX
MFESFRKSIDGELLVIEASDNLAHGKGKELEDLIRAAAESPEGAPIAAFVLNLGGQYAVDQKFLREGAAIGRFLKTLGKKFFVVHAPDDTREFILRQGMAELIPVKADLPAVRFALSPPAAGRVRLVPKLNVEFVNPFVEAALKTLSIQCQTEAAAGKMYLGSGNPKADIIGSIGIISPAFRGSIALCFPAATFLGLMGRMLGETYKEITAELQDGAGELLNIIFGQAKIALNERGYAMEKAIPTVIRGQSLDVRALVSSPTVVLPFETPVGNFFIEVSIEVSAEVSTDEQRAEEKMGGSNVSKGNTRTGSG